MWLSAHRLSANRVLGMQLTTKLMAKVGTVIGSGFSLAVYFCCEQNYDHSCESSRN